jgi:hypothetical protein
MDDLRETGVGGEEVGLAVINLLVLAPPNLACF